MSAFTIKTQPEAGLRAQMRDLEIRIRNASPGGHFGGEGVFGCSCFGQLPPRFATIDAYGA